MQKYVLGICLLLVSLTVFGAVQDTIPFTPQYWESMNVEVTFDHFKGRAAVLLSGHLKLKETTAEEGIIKVDVFCDGKRSFAGVIFHGDEHNDEEIYIRKHKSGQADAIQYTPVFNGESNWQLYHQYQAPVVFEQNQWNTLEVRFNKEMAVVFVNGVQQLVIDRLRTDNQNGYMGLWALFPGWFSNFSYTNKKIDFSEISKAPTHDPDGLITEWELSRAFPIDSMSRFMGSKMPQFIQVHTEERGLLPISKYIEKTNSGQFDRNSSDFVVVRKVLREKAPCIRWVYFDYSDGCIVQLNGTVLFKGNNAFRAKGVQFMGHLEVGVNGIPLHLKEGKNELVFYVTERANGWGIIGAISDPVEEGALFK